MTEQVYATLYFYADDPDSMRRFRLCNKAEDVMIVLFSLDQWLRHEIKYNDREELQVARDKLWGLCNEYEVDPLED